MQPTDFLGSGTVMGTHFAYVSWALEGWSTLPAACKNPTPPFQDTLKFIPGTSNHRVEGERKSNLPFNELDCNIKLHLVHHFQTDNRPPAVSKYDMPDVYSKHSPSVLVVGSVWGTVQKWNRKSAPFFSCSSHK